jgi:hypothetical protein
LNAYQAQAIHEVQTHSPELIVWASSSLQDSPEPSPCVVFLNQTLAKDYECIGGYIQDDKGGRWVEPISEKELPSSTVLLFKRKHSAPGNPIPGAREFGT